ncbi:unnamed protein product, partial [Discosporangium mesarthrocarpum]
MLCAASSRCCIPNQTHGPPFFSGHKCGDCEGYLHGICGVVDPRFDNEMKRAYKGSCALEAAKDKGKKKGKE